MIKGISYFGVRRPKWALEDMKEIKERGFTHVLHTWSEEDLLYYRDSMQEIIDGSDALGLKVYVNPWGVGRVFGGEAFSELVGRNFSIAQKTVDGKSKVAACPNQPEFRLYMDQWIEAVCKTKVDTIFWDEPHFYFEKGALDNWACCCDHCQKKFLDQYGFKMPLSLTPEVETFRENSLIDFLNEMTEKVHRLGKRNSLCLLPPWFPAGIENWNRIAELPFVDEISSDPYWEKTTPSETIKENYREISKRLLSLAQKYNKDAQMWIKNYHIVEGKESDVRLATEEAYNAGIRNIFAWSYRGSEYLSWLRSDNPELVFETQIHALENLK